MANLEFLAQAQRIVEDQRRRFNELVDVFDTIQPLEVMARLEEIVAAACLSPGEVVLDVGTGVGVLIPLIEKYHPSAVLACDLAEKMLERLTQKHPAARTYRADIVAHDQPATGAKHARRIARGARLVRDVAIHRIHEYDIHAL
jgi:cyclopropane fatty-acyl-phospholipid synthase-like methyltransferase